mmetsp:Transcript_15698/g.44840  ORF Transcript_15698/g.44840 Transcript_15698/m.44840 type:complete len:240 (-) Transcript_15698:640-1359(-)
MADGEIYSTLGRAVSAGGTESLVARVSRWVRARSRPVTGTGEAGWMADATNPDDARCAWLVADLNDSNSASAHVACPFCEAWWGWWGWSPRSPPSSAFFRRLLALSFSMRSFAFAFLAVITPSSAPSIPLRSSPATASPAISSALPSRRPAFRSASLTSSPVASAAAMTSLLFFNRARPARLSFFMLRRRVQPAALSVPAPVPSPGMLFCSTRCGGGRTRCVVVVAGRAVSCANGLYSV